MNRSAALTLALLLMSILTTGSLGRPEDDDIPSSHITMKPTYTGFLPIAKNAKMFYMYFEYSGTDQVTSDTPVILWFQGGPGASGLVGAFSINGPYTIRMGGLLKYNPYSWTNFGGMLYVDNPLGVGFSTVGNLSYPTTQKDVVDHMLIGLQVFYKQYPELLMRPLVLTGQSYAGKYIPAVGAALLRNGADKGTKMLPKLAAAAIGNGWTHPVTQVQQQANVAWVYGLISYNQKLFLERMQADVVREINAGNMRRATSLTDDLISTILRYAIDISLDEIHLAGDREYSMKREITYLFNDRAVKRMLGVNESFVYSTWSDKVSDSMTPDIMASEAQNAKYLMERIPVMFYEGNFDANCGWASNDIWLHKLDWSGADNFYDANRLGFYVDGDLWGWWKAAGNLDLVTLRNAGHSAVASQPRVAFKMMQKWMRERLTPWHMAIDASFASY